MGTEKSIGRLQASSIPYTVKQLNKMIDNGGIDFHNIIQRSYTWENKRRSEFIWSLIMNYPIPPIYAGRDINGDNKLLDIMDGQQRLTTIHKFLNDEFALSELMPIPITINGDESEIDISGMKFSELDEEIQDLIRDRTITIYYYDNITQEQKCELFKRLNNGKPLSTKSRALASCKDLENLIDIGRHELFSDMLSDKAIDNKNQVVIVAKCWSMINNFTDEISFESKVFNPFLENMEIAQDEATELSEVFDLIMNTHTVLSNDEDTKKIAKKLYTETHLVALTPFFLTAVANEMDENDMAGFVAYFFDSDSTSISDSYNEACGSGNARGSNIIARDTALQKAWNEYFEVENEVIEVDEKKSEVA